MHTLITYTFSLFQFPSQSPSRVYMFETTQDHHGFLSPTHSSVHSNLNSTFFFWPLHAACGSFVPRAGIEPLCSAVEAQSLNHWTTREVLELCSHRHSKHSYRCCHWTAAPLPSSSPFHSSSLSWTNLFVVVAMLHALAFPPPEWLLFHESVFLFQTAVAWTSPGLNPGFSFFQAHSFQRRFDPFPWIWISST